MDFEKYKTIEFSMAEQTHTLWPSNLNSYGHLFGGQLVAWIDEVASTVARRHCETPVTTACIDNLQFKRASSLNDMIVVIGRATYIGHTSMEVRVDTYQEDWNGTRYPVNRAYLTFVSLDKNEHPAPIRFGLTIDSESSKREWDMALKRIELRKERRKEGY